MKKGLISQLLFFIFIFTCGETYAQVTIGSDDEPESFSILQVVSSATNTGGLRLPHLTTQQRTDLNLQSLAEPEKTNAKGLLIYNTVKEVVEYWDGTNWVEAKTVEPWMISNSTNIATLNTQNIYHSGQVNIGSGATADPSAMLNITSADKGILIPRVTLASNTDKVSINGGVPTKSLLVYNTGANPAFPVEAFLFWNGQEWRLLPDTQAVLPEITNLFCTDATLTPSTYQAGIAYRGFLEVSYEGGNGASYSGTDWIIQTDYPSLQMNGLELRLQAGQLAIGSGKLIFEVRGTPTVTSPTISQLPVEFTDRNQQWTCTAEVGVANARIETRTYLGTMQEITSSNGTVGAEFMVTTMDERYSLRFYCRKFTNGTTTNPTPILETLENTDIQIRHNIAGKSNGFDNIIIMHQYTWGEPTRYFKDGNTATSTQYQYAESPNWSTQATSGLSHNNFVVPGKDINDASAPESGSWYAFNTQNNASLGSTPVDATNDGWHHHVIDGWRKHGDPAVYSNGRPEYRMLIFTPTDPNVKRVYRYTFFFGIPDGSTQWDNYTQTKCWVFAEEIISE